MTEQWLVVSDVNNIQGYIFDAPQLRAIRGASALVEEAGDQFANLEVDEDLKWKVLRSTGGQMVGILTGSEQDAKEISDEIERKATILGGPALTTAVASAPYLADAFHTSLSEAFIEIEATKRLARQALDREHSFSGGFVRHCDLCRKYPAAIDDSGDLEYEFGPGDRRYLCANCWKRVKAPTSQFEGKYLSQFGSRWSFPRNLDELWPGDNEGRYMATIAADGNNFGQLLNHIDSPTLYKEYAKALDAIMVKSIEIAARECDLVGASTRDVLRMMPIIAGGDDVTLLLPAEFAPQFAHSWANALARLSQERETGGDFTSEATIVQQAIELFRESEPELSAFSFPGQGPWPLTLALGLVVAKPHFPLRAYQRLAIELQTNAKRHGQRTDDRYRGKSLIDFAVITSAASESLGVLRERYKTMDRAPYDLTTRPYTHEDFGYLLALALAISGKEGLPRSQRKRLYSELWRTKLAGEEALSFALKRTSSARHAVEDALTRLNGHNHLYQARRTPMIDALELAELFAA